MEMPGSDPAISSSDSRELLRALVAIRDGDFTARLPHNWNGISGQIASTFNEIVELNQTLSSELGRTSQAAQKGSYIKPLTRIKGARRAWAGC